MQLTTLAGLVAGLLYLIGTVYQGYRTRELNTIGSGRPAQNIHSNRVFLIGMVAVAAHAFSAWGVITTGRGIHLGITEISTVIAVSISLMVLLSSLKKPLDYLIIALFPLAIIAIIISLTVPSPYPAQEIGAGIASHILFSILAYSFFTIAALQSLLLAFQNHQLRHRHAASVIKRFPPLQVMESLLFELLWVAQVLLTLGIVAGFLFIEDLWAQGLPHKMFFSLLAWLVFAALLWGRHSLGWRGTTAIKGTLTGFLFLILGFYGSRIVLEYVLA